MNDRFDLIQIINAELTSAVGTKDTSILDGTREKSKLRTPTVREVGRRILEELKSEGIREYDELLELCNKLLSTKAWPHRTIAFQWSFSYKKQIRKEHFRTFERWVEEYVTSWASCDDFCTHTMGYFLAQFPEFVPRIWTWTKSSNPYTRRASAVALIYGLRRRRFLEPAFDIAEILMDDEHIHVQKGYGWMLKEASKFHEQQVFDFVLKHKNRMPRVSLRYAIEKMSAGMREEVMAS
ncbi:MAG: DNA alkylation repair protein [Candidatus Thorarchaeota archaeon]